MSRRTGVSVDNLPLHPTPFVGREREIAEISALLNQTDCRLLTLVGPGSAAREQAQWSNTH